MDYTIIINGTVRASHTPTTRPVRPREMSLILDDRDPNIIYSSDWTLGGATTEYNSTTTYTDQAGAMMTLSFRGVGVAVYGTIGSSNANKVPPQTTYQLDETGVVTYVPTLMRSAQHYIRFYQSPQVSIGQHTLVVTNIIGGCDPYFIDYFVIQTGNNDTSSSTSSTGTTSVSGHHPSRTAVIVGSVFAVLGGFLVFVITYYLIRRRKKREWDAATEVPRSGVSPFQGSLTGPQPANDNSKAVSSTDSRLHNDDHATSSYRDSVAPPAYIP